MTSRQSDLEQIRRAMYKGQRAIGDYQAAQRGPAVLGRRLVRRSATREFFKILRGFGK